MSRSRFGGRRWSKLKSSWNNFKTASAPSEPPATIQDLSYVDAAGIWNLKSTTQFPKSNSAGSGGGGGGETPSYSTGFSAVLDTVSGSSGQWLQRTVDISGYAGATVRPVFHYVSGSSFTGDIQLDQISINGTTYGFESSVHNFERNQIADWPSYNQVAWEALATATSGNGRWLRDSGGTASGNTGLTTAASGSFYVYAETSGNTSGFPDKNFWLRGPQVTLGASPTFTYYEARSGATIGTLNVHLDVIA